MTNTQRKKAPQNSDSRKKAVKLEDLHEIHNRLRTQVIQHRGNVETMEDFMPASTIRVDGMKDIERSMNGIDRYLRNLGKAIDEASRLDAHTQQGRKKYANVMLRQILDEEDSQMSPS